MHNSLYFYYYNIILFFYFKAINLFQNSTNYYIKFRPTNNHLIKKKYHSMQLKFAAILLKTLALFVSFNTTDKNIKKITQI